MDTKKLFLISSAVVVAGVLLFALAIRSGSSNNVMTADVSLRDPLGTDGEEPIADEEILDEDGGSTACAGPLASTTGASSVSALGRISPL